MSPTQITPAIANPDATVGLVTQPRVVGAADANDVMRSQLEFLIEHAQDGVCGCEQCERFLRARSLLLTELFPESAPVVVMKKSSSSAGH
jgi:hypothetical protein